MVLDRVGGVGAVVLTVEFSVRLVRTGKSLLMVQVSVSEPCRGGEEEVKSDRAAIMQFLLIHAEKCR